MQLRKISTVLSTDSKAWRSELSIWKADLLHVPIVIILSELGDSVRITDELAQMAQQQPSHIVH
jgi:hypothetical protein